MSLQAASAGKHIHCEKPFCRSLAEGQSAYEAVRHAGVKLLVGETYVFVTAHVKARELIEAGEIGQPRQIRQRHAEWQVRPDYNADAGRSSSEWREDPVRSGGGRHPWIFDHAVHFFAAAEFFMLDQPVTEVYAQASTAARDRQEHCGRDIPLIAWRFADPDCQGVWLRADRSGSKYDYMGGFSTSIIGEKGMIEVLGEGGRNLLWNGQQQHLVLHRAGKEAICFRFDEGGDAVWDSEISYYGQAHRNQVWHLVDCILHDTEPRYSAEAGMRAVQCTLAAIRSAQEGLPIKTSEISPEYTAYQRETEGGDDLDG